MSVLCGYNDQTDLASRQRTTAAATLGCNLASFVEEQHQRPAHSQDLLQISTCLTQTHSQALPTTEVISKGQYHIQQASKITKTVTSITLNTASMASTSGQSNQWQPTCLNINHSLAVTQGYQELYPITAHYRNKPGHKLMILAATSDSSSAVVIVRICSL